MNSRHEVSENHTHRQEQDLLYQLAHDLARSPDVRTIANHLFTRAKNLLSADYGFLMLANPEGTELRGVAAYGMETEIFRQERIAVSKELAPVSLAFQQEQPVVIPVIPGNPQVSKRLRQQYHFVQAAWAVPLMNGDKAVGVLVVGYATPKEATVADLRLLQLLGDEAALAVERARLTEELREREEARQHSEEYFRLLIESVADDITILNADGTTRYESPSVERILGYKPEEYIGKNTFDFIYPDDVAKVMKAFTNLVRNPSAARYPQSVRFRSRHKDGSWRTLEAVGTNLLDNPTMAGIVVNSRDITARKQAEDALQQERNFVSAILNTVGALVVVFDLQGGIVRFNRACEQITGYSFGEVKGKPFWDLLLTPEERGPVRAGFEKLRAGEFPAEHENYWVAKDGTRRLIAWANTVLLDEAGAVTHIIGTGIDITARKQAEVLLKEEGEVTAALARVGQEMISSLDTPVILERLCRLTAEVLDCNYSHTTLWQPTEDAYVVVAGYGETIEQAEARRAFKMPRMMLAPLLTRLAKEEVIEFETEASRGSVTKSLMQKLYLTTTLWVPLWRGTEIIGMQSASRRGSKRFSRRYKRIARGISQIASLALGNARLFEELERANRLKEDFVSSMSHELRTPLNIIMGYTDLLHEESFGPLTAEQSHPLERINKSARELLDLINTTLDFSRLQSQRSPVSVREVGAAELLAELEVDAHQLNRKSSVRLEWQPTPALPSLYTDPLKLKMILKNLITNALKFTDEGVITIGAHPQGTGIEFCVSDTGIGIAPEALPIIFEPFRQVDSSLTRRHGGVGLGLYIVRQLLNLLGGTVAVESTLGKGSTFRVWVPLHARQ